MFYRAAKPSVFQVRIGAELATLTGWESCFTLGIVKQSDGAFASVALMNGIVLTGGFASLEQAHAFNKALIDHPKFFAGAPTVEEMYTRSGGEANFFSILSECAKKVQKQRKAA